MSESFATVINCTDGKVQMPVLNYIMDSFGVDFVDNITEPGAVKFLDNEEKENAKRVVLHSLKKKIELSVTNGRSKIIVIVAHHKCHSNEIGKTEQIKQLKTAKDTVESWKHDAEIVLLWVNENGEIEEV